MVKTTDEFLQDMLGAISDDWQKSPGFPMYDILSAVAYVLSNQSADVDYVGSKLDIHNLAGDELAEFIYERKGIERKDAVHAVGEVTVTVSQNTTIEAGTLFGTAGGVNFSVDETTGITAPCGTLAVTAVYGGAAGNAAAGTVTNMPITLANVTAVTNAAPMCGGYDAETDGELLDRYLTALQAPATSGNKMQYQQWAMEVDGVGGARVFPLANGDNTVEICIIGAGGVPANSSLIEAVQNYIDPNSSGCGEGVAPIGAYCTVTAAVAKAINVSGVLVVDAAFRGADVIENVKQAITKYINSVAFEVTELSYAKIGSLIMNVEGVTDYSNYRLNDGTSNISIGSREFVVGGTFNLTV